MAKRPIYKPVDKDWIYEKIQNRLGDNRVGDAVLRDFIDETESVICNFINREYVPEPLRFVFINMTMDLLKSQALNGMLDNDKLTDEGLGAYASIKDGDTELKLATTKTSTGAHVADVDSLLYNYKEQLMKYRIIKW